MSRTIWKFPIELTDRQRVMMPDGAVILSAAIQSHSGLCVWAEVDPSAVKQPRTVYVVGTGHPLAVDGARFVGTVLDPPFVWHVYVEQERA